MKALNFKNYAITLLAILAVVSTTGCSKDDHDHDGTGHVHVYFTNKYDGAAQTSTATYTGTNGRDFKIATNNYYISNVRLVDHDGAEVPFTGQYLLSKTGENNELELEGIAAGHYHHIRFDVGIDSVTNHSDPSTYASTSPLAPTTPSMHWSWNSGYIFYRIEGLVDTSAAKNGTVDGEWEMHLGTDSKLASVELDIDLEISEGSHPGLNITMNTEDLFTNIDLGGADIVTHTMDNMPLANKLKANIATAFTVE
jgi:hypothetical protein